MGRAPTSASQGVLAMSMKWEKIQSCEPRHEFASGAFYRSPVPGGWLLMIFWQMGHPGGPAMCFYPDPEHEWDGQSLSLKGFEHHRAGKDPAESR